jgi:hypothetical protein
MDDRPFGARFIDEMRRLTKSTWGLEYREIERLAEMDRSEFRATLGHRAAPFDKMWDGPGPVLRLSDFPGVRCLARGAYG